MGKGFAERFNCAAIYLKHTRFAFLNLGNGTLSRGLAVFAFLEPLLYLARGTVRQENLFV